jgi:site-specific DNA-methyltransferase (adenine-specific)
MVTSVDDRFTVDFEKVFFFSKQRRYYFNQQFEPMKTGNWESMPPIGGKKKSGGFNKTYSGNTPPSNPKGRNKRCVWNIPTGRFSGAHFAVYPEKLVEPILDAACPDGGIVLDPFFGSGTTGVVAKKQGKNFVGIDLNQEYADIARKRIFSA